MRLIDGDALIAWIKESQHMTSKMRNIICKVETMPSADRPQGEWKGYEIPTECSVCGHNWDEYVFGQDIWHDGSVPNYCPNCGAKMKGADDE